MEEKENKKKRLLIIAIVLLVISILLLLFIIFFGDEDHEHLLISSSQSKINSNEDYRFSETDTNDEVVVVGYSALPVNSTYPEIYLKNPNSDLYLKYQVYLGDKLLKETDLISPLMMESLNLYKLLTPGTYTLLYKISVYDLSSKNLLIQDINQEQQVIVS